MTRQRKHRRRRAIHARLQTLTGDFICAHVVDPETKQYLKFSVTDDFEETFDQKKEGADFFIRDPSGEPDYFVGKITKLDPDL